MRNKIDDVLYFVKAEEKIALTTKDLDAIVERTIDIAKNSLSAMIQPAKANGLQSITFGRTLIEFRVQHSQRKTLAITIQPSGARYSDRPSAHGVGAMARIVQRARD